MADMIVAGAGTTTVNGTYVENGTLNGKPLYIMQGQVDYPRIYFDSVGAWHIYAFNHYKGLLYYSNESVDTPDLCTTWNVSSWGTSPAPTVTAASSSQNLTLTCASGSYSLTGTNATLTVTRAAQNLTLSCNAGSYALTGTNASLTSARTLICEPASGGAYPDIIVSGAGTSDANGTYTYVMELSGKPLYMDGDNSIWWYDSKWAIINASESGNRYESTEDVATPDLVTTWTVGGDGIAPVPTVAAGTSLGYILTGSDVTLTYTQSTVDYSLICSAGSYALTGSNATFEVKRNYVLACGAGSYAVTGSDCTLELRRNYSLSLDAGSYALTGTNTGLTSARIMALASGSYALTGTDADFYRALVMACEAGSYALTGTAATLTYTAAGGVPKQYLHYARLRG